MDEKQGRFPTWPPHGEWDSRLVGADFCPALHPVEIVHENNWFIVRNRGGYFTTEPKNSPAVIVPVVDEKYFVMVRVLRPIMADATFEFPAGGFNLATESPYQGAARELVEETGIKVNDLNRFKPLPPLSVSPNRVPRLTYIFHVDLAGVEYEQRLFFDHEIQSVHLFSFREAAAMVLRGEVYVTMPVALIGRYLLARGISGL